MKCFKHKTDAVAVCAYCGRAMCEGVRDDPERTANHVLGGLRGGVDAKRSGGAIDPAKERAKSAGERVLLFPVRRIVGGNGSAGVVHIAFAVPDFFHCGVRRGADRGGSVVHSHLAETGLRLPVGPVFRKIFNISFPAGIVFRAMV